MMSKPCIYRTSAANPCSVLAVFADACMLRCKWHSDEDLCSADSVANLAQHSAHKAIGMAGTRNSPSHRLHPGTDYLHACIQPDFGILDEPRYSTLPSGWPRPCCEMSLSPLRSPTLTLVWSEASDGLAILRSYSDAPSASLWSARFFITSLSSKSEVLLQRSFAGSRFGLHSVGCQ